MFSATVMDHVTRPRNCGPLEGATHRGIAGSPGDGPYMILDFEIGGGVIKRAAYTTYGCPSAIACGSLVAEISAGRSPTQMLVWTSEDLMRLLGGLPEGKEQCAVLTILALQDALTPAAADSCHLPNTFV